MQPHALTASPLLHEVLAHEASDLVLAEWTDPGAPPGPSQYMTPLHVHHTDDEGWYVLEGTIRFRIRDTEVEAHAGGAVLVPRGTPHTWWNPSPEPARYLLIMTATIHRLVDAVHASPSDDRDAIAALFTDHYSEVLEWL